METAITLEYPNGRVHEAILTTRTVLEPGYQFDLFGRHWKAVQLVTPLRGRRTEQARMLCRSTVLAAPRS